MLGSFEKPAWMKPKLAKVLLNVVSFAPAVPQYVCSLYWQKNYPEVLTRVWIQSSAHPAALQSDSLKGSRDPEQNGWMEQA